MFYLFSGENGAVAGELSKYFSIGSIVSWLLHVSEQKKLAVLAKAVLIPLFEFASHSNSSGPRIIHRYFQE